MAESTALESVKAPSQERGIVRASGDVIDALTEYKKIQGGLDASMPDAIIKVAGRPFRKKQYWRAIRTAFNLDVTLTEERREQNGDDWGYIVTYRATAPNGSVADGDGSCFVSEKYAGQKTVHNVRSHAHTRAFNRAVSNLVGFGEVSAEEMPRGQAPEHDVPDHDETRGVDTHVPDEAPPIPTSVKPTEPPKETQPAVVSKDGISIGQAKRVWAVAYTRARVKGLSNKNAGTFIDLVLKEYGYADPDHIKYEHYDAIIQRIQTW